MKTQNENSLAAWHGIKDKIKDIHKRILVEMAKRPNATNWEIAEAIGHDPHALSPRFTELRRLGLIEPAIDENGKKIRRKNRKGNMCGAYQLCKKPVSQPTLFDQ